MELLLLYLWPGNIRQLQNELWRMIALADSDAVLTPASLCEEIRGQRRDPADRSGRLMPAGDKLAPTLRRMEREMIRAALVSHSGRVDAAAQALGISRKGLYLKRQRLGL
jgi:transcriptional regulator with PAS, ATPase and Fis domain